MGAALGGLGWFTVLVLVLLVYFVTHYFFASITAHMLALFPPFTALLIGVGVPPKLAVYSLMCLANLPAGLTHYGTTTGADPTTARATSPSASGGAPARWSAR